MPVQVDWVGHWKELAVWVAFYGGFGPGDDKINPGPDGVVFWDDNLFGSPDFLIQVEDGRVAEVEIHGIGANGPAGENVSRFGVTVGWLGSFNADFKRFFR